MIRVYSRKVCGYVKKFMGRIDMKVGRKSRDGSGRKEGSLVERERTGGRTIGLYIDFDLLMPAWSLPDGRRSSVVGLDDFSASARGDRHPTTMQCLFLVKSFWISSLSIADATPFLSQRARMFLHFVKSSAHRSRGGLHGRYALNSAVPSTGLIGRRIYDSTDCLFTSINRLFNLTSCAFVLTPRLSIFDLPSFVSDQVPTNCASLICNLHGRDCWSM